MLTCKKFNYLTIYLFTSPCPRLKTTLLYDFVYEDDPSTVSIQHEAQVPPHIWYVQFSNDLIECKFSICTIIIQISVAIGIVDRVASKMHWIGLSKRRSHEVQIQIPPDWLCGSHMVVLWLLQVRVLLRVPWGYSAATAWYVVAAITVAAEYPQRYSNILSGTALYET